MRIYIFTLFAHIYIYMHIYIYINISLRKKCPYSGLFCSTFFLIRTKYGEIWSISPHSVRMQENADQNNPEYEHFSCSVCIYKIYVHMIYICICIYMCVCLCLCLCVCVCVCGCVCVCVCGNRINVVYDSEFHASS